MIYKVAMMQDSCKTQLELVFREVAAFEIFFCYNPLLLTILGKLYYIIVNEIEGHEGAPQRYVVPTVSRGTLGRPIPHNQLAYLLEAQFSVPRIAEILGVSIRTVRHEMSEMFYTNIEDQQLN